MTKIKQVILLETDSLILIELLSYPKIKTPLEAMKALEEIEKVKKELIKKHKLIEVFISEKGAFRQIIKIEKRVTKKRSKTVK